MLSTRFVDLNSRFSTEHPEFRYPPSTNPYWTKIRELGRGIFLDHDAEAMRGKWREHFQEQLGVKPQRLVLEIGCNGGHSLLGWAKRHPDTAFLGIDWKFKQIFFAHQKAKKHGLNNISFLRVHAERIHYLFAEEELDCAYLLFPDPWPKTAHRNHRLFQPSWLKRLASVVKQGGYFEVRTDHPDYFTAMKKDVVQAPCWKPIVETADRHAGHPNPASLEIPEVTLFERVFISKGIPIQQMILERRG